MNREFYSPNFILTGLNQLWNCCSFDGILLGFQNVKLHSDIGLIGSDSYYIHMDVSADFFIFRPKLDMILNGNIGNFQAGDMVLREIVYLLQGQWPG